MESPECAELKNLIHSSNIVVLGTNFCGACVRAKKMLSQKQMPFLNIDISDDEKFQECLFRSTNINTIPQVFVNKKFIGGFMELKYLTDTKLLEDLVQIKI